MKVFFKLSIIFIFIIASTGFIKVSYYQIKAQLAQHLLESVWSQIKNNDDASSKQLKPWPWADIWPIFEIKLPSINESSLVLKNTSGESLAFGPGLMTPNQLPGSIGNSFIAAHRDTHFKNIGKLKEGDEIVIVTHDNKKRSFLIDKIEIVDSRFQQPIVESHLKRVTLVTCYPFNAKQSNTPFRYLVSAALEDNNELI